MNNLFDIYRPYTYLIGWASLDVWYYGVEHGHISKIAHPDNLWNTYFTSSDRVKAFRLLHGEPDVIQVRKIFVNGSIEEREQNAVKYEMVTLRRLGVIHKQKWLNQTNGKAIVLDELAKSKISKANKGLIRSDKFRLAVSERNKGTKNPFYGKKHSKETKKKHSEFMKLRVGWNHSEETKRKQSVAATGKRKSDSHKQAISASHNKVYECPHCNKSGGRMMLRWHFDKCKLKDSCNTP